MRFAPAEHLQCHVDTCRIDTTPVLWVGQLTVGVPVVAMAVEVVVLVDGRGRVQASIFAIGNLAL